MGTKIRWTREERDMVIDEVARNMSAATFEHGEFIDLLRKAQGKLPADRRRPVKRGGLGTSGPQFRELAKRRYLEMQKAKQPPASPATVSDPRQELALKIGSLMLDLVSEIGSSIASTLASSIRQELTNVATQHSTKPVEPEVHHGLTPVSTEREDKNLPSVLIVGTRKNWENELQRQYKGCFRLSFFNDPLGSSGLDKACQNVDRVLLNAGLSRHSHQAVIRASRKPMDTVHGSLSIIKRKLDDWYLTQQTGA